MIDNNFTDRAAAYTDLASLEKIKLMKDEKQALTEVAKQFEGIMMNMMLKSMRAANEVFGKDNFLSSNDTKFYQDMLDNQLSVTLSEGNGMGLAKMLVRQMTINSQHQDNNELDTYIPQVLSPQPLDGHVKLDGHVNNKAISEAYGTVQATQSLIIDLGKTEFTSAEEFVEHMLPIAEKVSQQTGVDPRLLVAQAALETGWGKHQIKNEDGSTSHNLFGIKANNSWQGDRAKVMTSEYEQGSVKRINADFRAYSSYEESFKDYIGFISDNHRYRDAVKNAHDPSRYINELQQAGYATDPNYADKVMRIFSSDEVQKVASPGSSPDSNPNKTVLPKTVSVRG